MKKALEVLGAVTAVALVNRGAAWQASQVLSAASDWLFNASEYFFKIVVK